MVEKQIAGLQEFEKIVKNNYLSDGGMDPLTQ